MKSEINVKPGDYVLYQSKYISACTEEIVKVLKVTPTGRIRIEGHNEQFNKYGMPMGKTETYHHVCIKTLTEDDRKRVEENSAISEALMLMNLKNEKNLSYRQAVEIIRILKDQS